MVYDEYVYVQKTLLPKANFSTETIKNEIKVNGARVRNDFLKHGISPLDFIFRGIFYRLSAIKYCLYIYVKYLH